MKVAVLLTGQPRCVHEGSWWWHNNCSPIGKDYHMDFYVHTWDPGEPNQYGHIRTEWKALDINPQYNPVMDNYTTHLNNFITPILEYNKTDEKTKYINDHVWTWFNSYHIGQFLSTYEATKMMLNTGIDYDFVIRTRFDSILNPMSNEAWMSIFTAIKSHTETSIFVPWLFIQKGLPMLGDLISIASFSSWKKYAEHLKGNLFDLLTKDKLILYPLNEGNPFITHIIWTMLGMPTNTQFHPISGSMPVDFRICLYRPKGWNKPIEESTYEELAKHYTNTEQGRNK